MAVTREATLLLMVLCVGGGVWGLGGYRHRNRHNQNYFSWGGQGPHDIGPSQSDERRTQEELLEALLSETASEDEGPCFGKRCTASEGCCRGAVCVDMDGLLLRHKSSASKSGWDVGTCLPMYGLRQGEPCQRDVECAEGLACIESSDAGVQVRSCQVASLRASLNKQYNDRCEVSEECDMSKGLCCQLQRRHRQAPRKVCVYYKEASNCLGNMEGAPRPPVMDTPKASPLKSHLG